MVVQLQVGKTFQLTPSTLDQRNHVLQSSLIMTYTSNDASVATVDSSGVIAAVAPGRCVITASSGGLSDQKYVEVVTPPPTVPYTPVPTTLKV